MCVCACVHARTPHACVMAEDYFQKLLLSCHLDGDSDADRQACAAAVSRAEPSCQSSHVFSLDLEKPEERKVMGMQEFIVLTSRAYVTRDPCLREQLE